MLRGAIKEVGVLMILNHYYYYRTGNYPLGENFNVRQAPGKHQELVDLIKANFEPQEMPTIVGVGDTVTSQAIENGGEIYFQRGGSDRGFLQLIQDVGQEFNKENIIAYVDSSCGEVKNRKAVKLESYTNHETGFPQQEWKVVEGPGDFRDLDEPLTLNIVFPQGHPQYINCFQEAAQMRKCLGK
jgi:glucosylglycerol 3-phosphatase